MSKAETLQRLANTSVRELVTRDGSGERQLFYHYQACCNSRLIDVPAAADDIARLHALFDVAIKHGMPALVVDYIVEVCSDPLFKSSDEQEAYLLDGESVGSWCLATLKDLRDRIKSSLDSGLRNSLAITQESGRLNGLISVIQALSSSGSTLGPSLEEATRLRQTLQVMEWALLQNLHSASSSGRFSSSQEWQLTVKRRRDASKPATTFLQDLLNELRDHHGLPQSFQYPPATLEDAVEGLFLHGSVDESSRKLKLAALIYYLLDAGHKAVLKPFGIAFKVSGPELTTFHARLLLDDAALQQPGNLALETACSLLPEAAPQDLPFKFIEALAARGRPKVALQLLRTRPRGDRANPEEALHEAVMAISILLDSNLVTEAYIELRRFTAESAEEQRIRDTWALIYSLANWAAENSALGRILQLPLLKLEEQALLEWLEDSLSKGEPQGDFLVLFHIMRQRFPEALHAFARLSEGGDSSPTAEFRALLKEMLASAAHLLPQPQRGLAVHAPGKLPLVSESADVFSGAQRPSILIGAKIVQTVSKSILHVSGSATAAAPLFGPLVGLEEELDGRNPTALETGFEEEETSGQQIRPSTSHSIFGGLVSEQDSEQSEAQDRFGAGFDSFHGNTIPEGRADGWGLGFGGFKRSQATRYQRQRYR